MSSLSQSLNLNICGLKWSILSNVITKDIRYTNKKNWRPFLLTNTTINTKLAICSSSSTKLRALECKKKCNFDEYYNQINRSLLRNENKNTGDSLPIIETLFTLQNAQGIWKCFFFRYFHKCSFVCLLCSESEKVGE